MINKDQNDVQFGKKYLQKLFQQRVTSITIQFFKNNILLSLASDFFLQFEIEF